MTHDIVLVEGGMSASGFARKVLETVKRYENEGFDVEVQYSPRDEYYSAMVIVYHPAE